MSRSDQENAAPVAEPRMIKAGSKRSSSALELGPRKRPTLQDPLVGYGRHFGRTVHAFCNVHTLLTNALNRIIEEEEESESEDGSDKELSSEERRETCVYTKLLKIVPDLEKRMLSSSAEVVRSTADLIQKGASSARADDTKTIKTSVIDWITPRDSPLIPPLARNRKTDRGFNHDATGALLCPATLDWSDPEIKAKLRDAEYIVAGDQWPLFIYKGYKYNPENPWEGLLRSQLLISAYKHVFTSPSSVDKEPKATRSGNARIHGMTAVTIPSIAYIATQVRFALSSTSVFSNTDTVTDSQRFYTTIVDFLEDPDEEEDVLTLLTWWNHNRQLAIVANKTVKDKVEKFILGQKASKNGDWFIVISDQSWALVNSYIKSQEIGGIIFDLTTADGSPAFFRPYYVVYASPDFGRRQLATFDSTEDKGSFQGDLNDLNAAAEGDWFVLNDPSKVDLASNEAQARGGTVYNLPLRQWDS